MISGVTNLAKGNQPTPSGTDRAVRVFAQPIQLPETDANWEQQEYSIYIWASHPAYPGLGIRRLVELGLLQLDIIGAPFKPREAGAGDTQKTTAALNAQSFPGVSDAAVANGQVMELVVRAGDIREPIRIAAWFPSEYRMALASARASSDLPGENKHDSTVTAGPANWSDQAFVPIRSGDLTTKIEIVDQIEARAAFGDEFPRHFYIGRIYLRNTNSTKKLIVYTTSMRAPVYLYRRTDPDLVTTPETRHSTAGPGKGADKDGKNPGTHSVCDADSPCKKPYDAPRPGPVFQSPPSLITASLLSDIQSFGNKSQPDLNKEPDPLLKTVRTNLHAWLNREKLNLDSQLAKAEADLKTFPADAPLGESKPSPDIKKKIQAAWSALRDEKAVPEAAYQNFAQAVNALGTAAAKKPLDDARKLKELQAARLDLKAQANFLSGDTTPPVGDDLSARLLARALASGLIPQDGATSPFSDAAGLSVGLVDQTAPIAADQRVATQRVLFSQNPREQLCLDHLGYIWRDSSRPLTFQAVLNSLILTQDQATRTKVVKVFDIVGRVAGGLIALGPVEEEFGREGYARVVAFYASVITPELGSLLLEDLKAHVRNLGEMSMDTIMVIPPRSVEDRYVFFPRGPVFNHPDEFDQHSPAYIVKVLGDDLAVQAELVDANFEVNGPALDSGALTARFNTGTAPAAALLARQAQVRAQAANSELSLTLGKIEKTLIKRAAIAESNQVARTAVENEARRLAREFRRDHSTLGDSAFAELFAQYGLLGDDSPPELDALPGLRLIAGAVGASRPLPVKDDRTPLSELVVKAEVAGANTTWSSEADADGKARSYRVDSAGATLTGTPPVTEERNVRITIKDSSGNAITVEQIITLETLVSEFSLDEGKLEGDTLALPKSSRPTLAINVPLLDTAAEGWTVELTGTNQLDIRPARLPLNLSASGRLNANVSLDVSALKDPSGAAATTAKLTLLFRQGEREIWTQTLTVNAQ